jgi:hypothetical protein
VVSTVVDVASLAGAVIKSTIKFTIRRGAHGGIVVIREGAEAVAEHATLGWDEPFITHFFRRARLDATDTHDYPVLRQLDLFPDNPEWGARACGTASLMMALRNISKELTEQEAQEIVMEAAVAGLKEFTGTTADRLVLAIALINQLRPASSRIIPRVIPSHVGLVEALRLGQPQGRPVWLGLANSDVGHAVLAESYVFNADGAIAWIRIADPATGRRYVIDDPRDLAVMVRMFDSAMILE